MQNFETKECKCTPQAMCRICAENKYDEPVRREKKFVLASPQEKKKLARDLPPEQYGPKIARFLHLTGSEAEWEDDFDPSQSKTRSDEDVVEIVKILDPPQGKTRSDEDVKIIDSPQSPSDEDFVELIDPPQRKTQSGYKMLRFFDAKSPLCIVGEEKEFEEILLVQKLCTAQDAPAEIIEIYDVAGRKGNPTVVWSVNEETFLPYLFPSQVTAKNWIADNFWNLRVFTSHGVVTAELYKIWLSGQKVWYGYPTVEEINARFRIKGAKL